MYLALPGRILITWFGDLIHLTNLSFDHFLYSFLVAFDIIQYLGRFGYRVLNFRN